MDIHIINMYFFTKFTYVSLCQNPGLCQNLCPPTLYVFQYTRTISNMIFWRKLPWIKSIIRTQKTFSYKNFRKKMKIWKVTWILVESVFFYVFQEKYYLQSCSFFDENYMCYTKTDLRERNIMKNGCSNVYLVFLFRQ